VVSHALVLAVVGAGIPASLFRLWLLWWSSDCLGCGLQHRACECPPDGPMMRPKR